MNTKSAIICILLSSIFYTCVYGQVDVKGPMIRMTTSAAWADLDPIGEDGTYVYYIHIPYGEVMSGPVLGDSDYYLGKVNKKSMELDKTEVLDLSYGDSELTFEFAARWGSEIYIFSSFQNSEQKKTYLFVQSVNTSSLTLNDDLKKIGEVDFSGESKYKNASFDYEFSLDSSRVLMTHSLLDKEGSMLRFGYEVYDKDFNQLDQWTGNLAMADGIYLFDQFRISNDGEVFLLTRYYPDKKTYRKSTDMDKDGFLTGSHSVEYEANYEIRVVRFNKEQQETSIIPIELAGQFLTTVDIGLKDNHVILIGFYSPVGSTLPEGAAFIELNPNGKVLKMDKKIFGDLFKEPSDTQNKSNGILGNVQYDNYRFVLDDIYYKSDGGLILAGERTVVQTKTQNSGGTVTVTTVYHTDDLAIIDVSPDGDIQGVHKIEKNQQTTGLGYLYSSFFIAEVDGEIHILLTSLGKSNVTMLGKLRGTQAELISIGKTGTIGRQEIFNSDDHRITLRAQDCYFTNEGEVVIYGHENNRFARFMKASLN